MNRGVSEFPFKYVLNWAFKNNVNTNWLFFGDDSGQENEKPADTSVSTSDSGGLYGRPEKTELKDGSTAEVTVFEPENAGAGHLPDSKRANPEIVSERKRQRKAMARRLLDGDLGVPTDPSPKGGIDEMGEFEIAIMELVSIRENLNRKREFWLTSELELFIDEIKAKLSRMK